MNQHGGHAERIGHQAGMLAAGAAEAVERIARHIVAALHGDLLDRVRHVLDRNPDEAVSNVLYASFAAEMSVHLVCQISESSPHTSGIERLILRGSENMREEVWQQLADHDIGISEGERSAASITFRPRIGAGRVG